MRLRHKGPGRPSHSAVTTASSAQRGAAASARTTTRAVSSWPFMRWIWSYPAKMRPKTARMLQRLRPDQRVYVLRSRSEIAALEAELSTLREAA